MAWHNLTLDEAKTQPKANKISLHPQSQTQARLKHKHCPNEALFESIWLRHWIGWLVESPHKHTWPSFAPPIMSLCWTYELWMHVPTLQLPLPLVESSTGSPPPNNTEVWCFGPCPMRTSDYVDGGPLVESSIPHPTRLAIWPWQRFWNI